MSLAPHGPNERGTIATPDTLASRLLRLAAECQVEGELCALAVACCRHRPDKQAEYQSQSTRYLQAAGALKALALQSEGTNPMQGYVKKITTELAWKRPVTADVPLMRVQGECLEGWEEMSTYGTFVRWRGRFAAQIATAPLTDEDRANAPLGILKTMGSYVLILPAVASDWLMSYFDVEEVKIERRQGETRTGRRFKPAQELDCIHFVTDIHLVPGKNRARVAGDDSEDKGYEYAMHIAKSDTRYDPMGGLLAQSDGLAPLMAPKLAAPVQAAPTQAPATAKSGRGSREASAEAAA